MKKALASKLQLHVSGTRSIESATRNFGLPSEDTIEDINDVFKVFEVSAYWPYLQSYLQSYLQKKIIVIIKTLIRL